ncbi:hypothetical protein CYLTODRAFT_425980 [Cylindrobasidium torrendii FP15055 ss-10]|uniref:Uncharacterized protein n=1 Tax=Cylindrobasidium torrendii FP15055 ss-10 TaxID=1314674 RepID=A0A0D7B224_9AGAR|nr:hypothetical protein CYLTODRAFT_425980 [Cylindrobasidium torrendii FP15055 ss-10]
MRGRTHVIFHVPLTAYNTRIVRVDTGQWNSWSANPDMDDVFIESKAQLDQCWTAWMVTL